MGTDQKRNTSELLWDKRTDLKYYFKMDMLENDKYIHEATESEKGSYSLNYVNNLDKDRKIDKSLLFTMSGEDTQLITEEL